MTNQIAQSIQMTQSIQTNNLSNTNQTNDLSDTNQIIQPIHVNQSNQTIQPIYINQPDQPIQLVQPTQTNTNIMALLLILQYIYTELYNEYISILETDDLLHFINIMSFNYNNEELIRKIIILHNAFSYILIKNMIIGALNDEQDYINELYLIDPDLLNIIRSIHADDHGYYILSFIIENI